MKMMEFPLKSEIKKELLLENCIILRAKNEKITSDSHEAAGVAAMDLQFFALAAKYHHNTAEIVF